ncbi:esterase [Mycobacterium sp. 852002-51057_SCH5723018]|uniref:esterase n=1 Tax=Mycobacterium sp. 852002-51057_SCH5723018 TaxID=1834094 RepID=UPI0012E7BC5C|nr:esterase [Mycobacterium sp. 852002-51057_SCH5723018]
MAGAVGCGTSGNARQTTSTASTATTTVAAQGQSPCADLNGTVRPDQTCHLRSATPDYTIDISFPLDYPDMRAVTDFLKRDRAAFLDWVARFGPSDRRGRPYQYMVAPKAFRSGSPDRGTQSLVLRIDNDTGFAHEGHPNTTFRALNFDLGKRAPITFDTLFKPEAKPLEVLNPIVRRQLNAPTADLDAGTYQNFAITNEAVVFFFGQDQVVRDNAGPHKVTVPRSDLASLLA